jgi:deferrochelatase/peroxidase EfeB
MRRDPTLDQATAPAQPSRRRFLGTGLIGGAATVAAGLETRPSAAETPCADLDPRHEAQAFFGRYQPGILNPQPPAASFVAFDVLADNLGDLQRLFQLLTERIAFLMAGGTPEPLNPQMPPADNGVLGPETVPDNLTITIGLGASLFDQRFGLASARPRRLRPMDQFPNDALEASFCHGDLLLQICANSRETVIHALRSLIRATPDLLAVRWKMDGFLPPRRRQAAGRETPRNLLGFKDGTANLDASDPALMDQLVWVQPDAGEPTWARDGSYQVVRLIGMTVERWDRTPLREQQEIIGRDKASGAPLGLNREHDVPDYNSAAAAAIPMNAHIRLANPRSPESHKSLILRRPYNFSRDTITKAGQLEMGLLFVCFQSDLDRGFHTVQTRLNGEPLEEYIKPFGGGYFFVPAGVSSRGDYLARALVERRAI